MAEELNERSDPAQFIRIDADHGNGLNHDNCLSEIFSAMAGESSRERGVHVFAGGADE
jgi:hypothetical protein